MCDLSDDEKKDYMYYKLVQSDSDLIGQIAYANYKKSKIEHIIEYKRKHKAQPTPESLIQWQKQECIENHVKMYRDKAQKDLSTLNGILITEQEKKHSSKEAELNKKEKDIQEREKEVRNKEKDLKNRDRLCKVKSCGWVLSSLISITQNLVASIIFVIISLLIVISISQNTDLVSYLGNLFTKK